MPDAGFLDQVHERQPAAIENGHFQVIDFDERVVNPHAVEHAQEVLCSRDQNALPHQAGRIADARYMPPARGNGEVFKIGPDEDDSSGNRGGTNTDRDGYAAVKANACCLGRSLERRFKNQRATPQISLRTMEIYLTLASRRPNVKYFVCKKFCALRCGEIATVLNLSVSQSRRYSTCALNIRYH